MVAERLVDLVAWLLVIFDCALDSAVALGVVSAVSAGLLWLRALRARRVRDSKISKWRKLIRKLQRIRRLQRLFAVLGNHLRDNVNKNVLRRLK